MIRIENIDCKKLLAKIATGSVDLMLQDPPYGVTQNEWDNEPPLLELWPEWERVIKDNGAMIFFAQQPFASKLILSRPGFFRYDLIWYKALGSGFLNANRMPMRNHEHILVFYKALPTYNPQKYIGKMRDKGRKNNATGQSSNYGEYKPNHSKNDEYHPQSVIDFSNGDRTKESYHPTQKPVDLMRYLIRTYSNPGNLVFDVYSGSGTVADACAIEGRNCIAAEIGKEYYEYSLKRIAARRMKPELFTPTLPPAIAM